MGKADRIIQIYFKLISEHSAMKRQLEKEFETDRRSIERDINEVKDMLSSRGYIIRHERTEDGVRYKLAIADQTRADTGFLSEPQLLMIIDHRHSRIKQNASGKGSKRPHQVTREGGPG